MSLLLKSILWILLLGVIPVSGFGQSVVPPLISFQGFLTDDVGDPIDGTETVMFAMHTDSVVGSQLWAETQSVTLSNGLMDVTLGSVEPIADSVFYRDEVYLAIKVGSDDWMSPRSRLTSSAWAFGSGCVISIWYEDSDGDGFGNDSITKVSCTEPAGYVANNADCNDGVESIFPGATELCNGIDDNCSTVADDAEAGSECNDDLDCTVDSCSGGACLFDPTPMNGAGCDDGNLCTTNDLCSGGGCFGTPVACDGGTECTDSVCNPSTGGCEYPPKPNGTPCSLGTCNGLGTCIPS